MRARPNIRAKGGHSTTVERSANRAQNEGGRERMGTLPLRIAGFAGELPQNTHFGRLVVSYCRGGAANVRAGGARCRLFRRAR